MVSVRRLSVTLLTASLLLSSTPASAKPTLRKRAALAARFLVTNQESDGSVPALSAIGSTADAVLSWVAVKRAPRAIERALDYLAVNEAEIDTLGEIAKVALAWLAGGRDMRDFAGRDLVSEIEGKQEIDGRYDATSSVFSHANAMMALQGAGGSATLPAAAQWLIDAQCDGGGWAFLEPATEAEDENCSLGPVDIDTANPDTTSLAIQANEALPVPLPYNHDPFAYFLAARDPIKRGWGYGDSTAITNANSTGMVLQAYGAADIPPPAGSMRSLVRLQGKLCGPSAGSFYYSWEDDDGDGTYERFGRDDLAATIAALPGLLLTPQLMSPTEVTKPAPKAPRC